MTNQIENHSVRRGKPPLVYVVDDEPMVLELTRLILEPYGYELRLFRDPIEALEAFRAADPKPELVLTDYAMNEMSGIELIRACREAHPGQKVFLVSGTIGREVCREIDPGPDEFLPKPFDVTEFANVVQRLTS